MTMTTHSNRSWLPGGVAGAAFAIVALVLAAGSGVAQGKGDKPKAGKLPVCTEIGNVAKWDGTLWVCAPDDNSGPDAGTATLGGLGCTEVGDIAVYSASKWICEPELPRFVDNLDGTVTDNDTGLMWEKKVDTGGVHDVTNAYTWSQTGSARDGTLYTDFLETLNRDVTLDSDQVCFANHCDWRIPNVVELQSILPEGCPTTVSCVDETTFGPTDGLYWSSSSATDPLAWDVSFSTGMPGPANKQANNFHARAVRDNH
ncbi:MAG: DUF1566 domain-containing protein [Lysobacterales bacterium]|nr:MAG: DUF1566 domain-containing protein [Xanthomonadales bacterium]